MLSASITILAREPQFEVSPLLHGQFIEHLGDQIAGLLAPENSAAPHENGMRGAVLDALREIAPPVVRWPGGCFADVYDWRDGIGPRENRPTRVTSRWGADEIGSNAFGTHEFLELCAAIGAKPWLAGNVGSGSPRELAQWAEYCNFAGGTTLSNQRAQNGAGEPFGVEFWGIGNENWDCGGQMTPETYAANYRQFESAFPRFAGQNPFLIACGPSYDAQNPAETAIWTRRFFQHLDSWRAPRLHGYDADFYTGNGQREFGGVQDFSLDEYYGLLSQSLKIGPFIDEQRAILNASPIGRGAQLILGEWGIWHPSEADENGDLRLLFQQNTLRDALSAALTLDVLHEKADKVAMAALAQSVNVLQSLLLTWGETVVKTPTFHVFSLYKAHRGGHLVPSEWQSGEAGGLPRLSGSATINGDVLTLSVVNTGARSPVEAQISLPSVAVGKISALELNAASLSACNTPENAELVAPRAVEVSFEVGQSEFTHTFAPASICVFQIQIAA